MLQIENEFYGTIRPKRVIFQGERPLHALRERGVEYVEVRLMDLDPFEPLGINAQTLRFLDVFLLYCLTQPSPDDTPQEIAAMARNQQRVAERGREPGLELERDEKPIGLAVWGEEIVKALAPIATALDAAHGSADYSASLAMAELGLQRVTETEAGIEIDLPMAMIRFDRYEPPFVRYEEADGSGVTALLISQPGDATTLSGLYDLLQTLEIVPPAAERSRGEGSFTITGRNDRIESYSYAALSGGLVKGFTLVWPVKDAAKMARVLDAMKASFRPVGDRALDPGLAPMDAAQRDGMLTGLEVRRPALSRSGFFITATGTVLTTVDVLQSCARVTIDGDLPMSVALSDAETGLAVLVPDRPLSPPGVAGFQTAPERTGAEVAVAGYPYEDRLTSPTLTFGFVEALEGLNGEPGLKRLNLPALAGDAGGPVVDGTGAVIGMMLPRALDAARQLPPDVSFALAASRIEQRLAAQGIALAMAPAQGALPPQDLNRRARGMTVRVACWN